MNALTASLPALRVQFEQIASSWFGLPGAPAEGHGDSEPTHVLRAHDMLWLATVPGLRVSCLDGCILLQYQGRPRDVILVRGETHTCDRSARVAIQAFVDTALQVE